MSTEATVMTPTMKKVLIYGGLAIAGLLVLKKIGPSILSMASKLTGRGGASASASGGGISTTGPAKVMGGQKVEAATFTFTGTRAPGQLYVSARLLGNGHVEFTSPQTGFFTRRVLRSGGIFAEVTPG